MFIMTFINSLLWPSRVVIVHYLAMLATIRVGLKVVDNDNTLAYYGTELITVIRSKRDSTLRVGSWPRLG